MAATTLGFIPLQLIPTSALGQYQLDKGFSSNGTYVVVKTPTVAQQLQLTKSIKEMQNGGKEINNNENANSKPVLLRCKRRVDFSGMGCKIVDPQNPSVSRRNERERKRVKMVNMGFETLRQHVPVGRKNKKMSKVETLRSAVQYIKQLQDMLDGSEGNLENLIPENMDMDALEDKVTEIIKNVNDSNNNTSSNSENSANNNYNNGLELALSHNSDLVTAADAVNCMDTSSNSMNMCEELGARLQTTISQQQMQQTMSPQSSPDLPCSPDELDNHQQQHFFPAFPSHPTAGYMTSHYNAVSSASSMTSTLAYSQASPEGSLHSPTSSVVSDSSYESMGHDDEDYLQSLSNWFQ